MTVITDRKHKANTMKLQILHKEVPIIDHPMYKYQRNKRKRMRFKRDAKKRGFTSFLIPYLADENGNDISKTP